MKIRIERTPRPPKTRKQKIEDWIGSLCLVFILCVAFYSIATGGAGKQAGLRDRDLPAAATTMYGTAAGRNEDLTVKVVAGNDKIYQIKVVQQAETDGIGTKAVDELPAAIYEAQSLKVDAVTGATISSEAIKQAVYNALENGGFDPANFGGSPVKADAIAKQVETGVHVEVLKAADWEEKYPEITASWRRNGDNEEIVDYLEAYPMIETLYEPYGFSVQYGSARGHIHDVEDLMDTARPHPLANCFTCKTPEFTALVNEMGDAAYSLSFEDVAAAYKDFDSVSCYNCHANTPGKVTVTHSYLIDAVGADFEHIDAANLACGQCHVEYYFDPVTKATTLPHDSIASMHPDTILAYYNDPDNWGGDVFTDYTNPRTGVKQIKVQHPELETYIGEGSQHRATYTCADCHMGTEVAENGKHFTSHYLSSPLDNEELIANECSKCHVDLVAEVKAVQEESQRRTYAIGYELEYLTEQLAAAVESGDYTDAELDAIRSLNRDAQYYWDFVFVENSNGAHNPKLSTYCLDKAEQLCNEALNLFKR